MKRLVSLFATAAMVAALGSGALAMDKMKDGMKSSMSKSSSMMKCGTGKKWVKGYTKKDGTKVKGYCR